MVSHLVFYQLMLLALVWVFLLLSWLWPSESMAARPTTSKPLTPPRKRSTEAKPCPSLTRQPHCDACAQAIAAHREPPCAPSRRVATGGRQRPVDTSQHGCPAPDWRSGGWRGLGHIPSPGHPRGGPWRQRYGNPWQGYCRAPHGTILQGKRGPVDKRVWAVGALAEGWGLRAVARVFAVDPTAVLAWLGALAAPTTAVSPSVLHAGRGTQVQLDARFALLPAVQTGEGRAAEAVERLSPASPWLWAAIDPVTKLRRTVDVGDRTLQRDGLRQAVAAADPSDGRWADGAGVDPPGGGALARAAVAAASGEVSPRWWWEAARGGGLSGRGAFTRLAAWASPGLRGPLGGHESPLG